MERRVWSDAGQIMRVFATLIKSIARSNENPAVSSSGVVGSDFFGMTSMRRPIRCEVAQLEFEKLLV